MCLMQQQTMKKMPLSHASGWIVKLLLLLLLLLCALPGRYFGQEAAQIIIKLAAGSGFKKVYVGRDAIMATPAMSAFIRRRKLYGRQEPWRVRGREG